MSETLQFKGCDSETVFSDVTANARSVEARKLWVRTFDELKRNGVDGAVGYLEEEFNRIRDDLRAEIQRLESER